MKQLRSHTYASSYDHDKVCQAALVAQDTDVTCRKATG